MPYSSKVHGYTFATDLPILLVKIRHRAAKYLYPLLEDVQLTGVALTIKVQGLRTLTVSNDFGPVDTSKPFQPFGPSPVANSTLVVGSKELFQKNFSTATLNVDWQAKPAPYKKTVMVKNESLQAGQWQTYNKDTKYPSKYFQTKLI